MKELQQRYLKPKKNHKKKSKMDNIYSVLITAFTVLGSAAAFRFYEKKSMRKERDEEFIRHDCRDRISKLEALLVAS